MNQSKRKGKSVNTNDPKTLAYFKNGIGNWVLMTPALQALASMDASGKIILVTDSSWNDSRTAALNAIWAATPWIHRVIRYPTEVYREKAERVFYSKHSEGGDALSWIESLEPSAGNQVSWIGTMMHERDYYMALVERLGYKGHTPEQSMPTGKNPVEGNLGALRYIVICNGAFGKMRTQKQWPHFAALVRALKFKYGLRVFSVGSGDELRETRGIVDEDYCGKISILESAAVVKNAALFVTTDTGMMHIADALHVNQLVLFGGSVVSKNGPVNNSSVVVRSGETCQPCQYTANFDTCADARCMRNLSVGEVMAYVAAKL